MKTARFLKFTTAAAIVASCIPSLSADILTADFVNPVDDGIVASIQVTLNNVTGELTTTWVAPVGDFFNGEYQFSFNAGDPSRGTVNGPVLQNVAFLDPVATLANASSYTMTEDPGSPDYDGSVAGWLAGDTVITCGNTLGICKEFFTGVYSFDKNAFVSEINIGGTLQSSSSAPESGYWGLVVLCVGFMAIRKRACDTGFTSARG